MIRVHCVLSVPCVLLLIGCTTQPKSTPAPTSPRLAWSAQPGVVYFVNYAPFSVPDVYICLDGPLHFESTNAVWQTTEPGLYAVGAECAP